MGACSFLRGYGVFYGNFSKHLTFLQHFFSEYGIMNKKQLFSLSHIWASVSSGPLML